MTSRTLTGVGQVKTETDKGMNSLIINYQTRTRTIFRAGRSNNARNLTAETTNNETTTKIMNLSRKKIDRF